DRIIANVRQINPHVVIFPVSAKTGEGLAAWFQWVYDLAKSRQA
ncbi:MAG: hydrogenase accessory protein HypB, partial [Candidatus Nanopelagicaceae bacterium]